MEKQQKELHRSPKNVKDSYFLILHNDDINTFDFVIDLLIDFCDHDELQAEQCVMITHHKGRCDIKKGAFSILSDIKDKLLAKGLSVTIES